MRVGPTFGVFLHSVFKRVDERLELCFVSFVRPVLRGDEFNVSLGLGLPRERRYRRRGFGIAPAH